MGNAGKIQGMKRMLITNADPPLFFEKGDNIKG
jgi:hypothetical protein